jgi:hypothetical protein
MMTFSHVSWRCVGVAVMGLTGFALPARAGETWSSKILDTCPLEASIRTPDPSAMERFSALSSCAGQFVAAPVQPADERPDVVRILGVKVKPESKEKAPARRGTTEVRYTLPTGAWDAAITRTASTYKIDPLFLHAVIHTESRYRPTAVSSAGAVGLMQIMPATGLGLGVSRAGLSDGAINIDAGARHLKRLQRRYGRNFDLILAAYNAGEGAVAKAGNRIPRFAETQAYVGKVMGRYVGLRAGLAQ